MDTSIFNTEKLLEAWEIIKSQFLLATWETVYVTFLATFFAAVIGLPLGVILVTGEEKGIHPLPKNLMRILNLVINILRSIPFLILMILVFPLTRLICGTVVGTFPTVVPLVIAAFPFVARLVETSIREVNPNTVEMAQSLGASPMQIVMKVLIPESVPSLVSNLTIAATTILGYTAMSWKNRNQLRLLQIQNPRNDSRGDSSRDSRSGTSEPWNQTCNQYEQKTEALSARGYSCGRCNIPRRLKPAAYRSDAADF